MSRPSGEAYRHIRVCVDEYDRGRMSGRYYSPGLPEGGGRFHSMVQFLAEVEQMLDNVGFLQSYTAKRSFGALPDFSLEKTEAGSESQNGQCGTFVLRLLFRQHSSWQGSVTWLEGKGEQAFRSVLELILLMDGALNSEVAT